MNFAGFLHALPYTGAALPPVAAQMLLTQSRSHAARERAAAQVGTSCFRGSIRTRTLLCRRTKHALMIVPHVDCSQSKRV